MNSKKYLTSMLLAACLPITALANGTTHSEVFIPAPNQSNYHTQKEPSTRIQKGPYISVDFLAGSIRARKLMLFTSPESPSFLPVTSVRETGLGVTAALGCGLTNTVWFLPNRLEAEYSFRDADFDFGSGIIIFNPTTTTRDSHTITGNLQSHLIMFNAYNDLSVGSFRPYIGGGIGFAYNRTDTTTDNTSKSSKFTGVKRSTSGFAWNFRTGFHFQLNEALDLNCYFEHAQADEAEWELRTRADPNTASPPYIMANKLNNNTFHIGVIWKIEDLTKVLTLW